MRLLLIHTAGGDGSVALVDTAASLVVVAVESLPGRTASERLVPAVRRLLEASGWRLSGLDAIGVVHGPGSFTGVRVGVAAAKGLSEAADVPLVAISRLALVAAAVDEGETVHAVLDAGRGEFYYGEYRAGRCVREALVNGEGLKVALVGGVVVTSESKVMDALAGLGFADALGLVGEPGAADALRLVEERVAKKEFDDAAVLDANYLRRTDVEIFSKPSVLPGAKLGAEPSGGQ